MVSFNVQLTTSSLDYLSKQHIFKHNWQLSEFIGAQTQA